MRRTVATVEAETGRLILTCGHRVEAGAPSERAADREIDCDGCAARELPATVAAGRRTPTFTEATVPPALTRDHLTATWARLEVDAGTVVFTEDDPPFERMVEAGDSLVIVVGRPHRVAPGPGARFAVQFFDLGDPNEPRSTV